MSKVQALLLIYALGMSACSYSPPDATDLNRPSYHTDLATCREVANKAAHHLVTSLGGYFLTYPISLPVVKHREMSKCMQRKGYISHKS